MKESTEPVAVESLRVPARTSVSGGIAVAFVYGVLLPFEYAPVPLIGLVSVLLNAGLLLMAIATRPRLGLIPKSLIVFTYLTAISLGWASNEFDGGVKLVRLALCVLLFAVISQNEVVSRALRSGLMLGTTLAAALLLFTSVGTLRIFSARQYGLGQNENDLAGFFVLGALACGFASIQSRRFRVPLMFAAHLCLAALIRTGSRSGLAAIVVAVLFAFVVSRRHDAQRKSQLIRKRFQLVSAVAVIGAVVFLPGLGGRSETFFVSATAGDLGGRNTVWVEQLDELLQDPLRVFFGIGLGEASANVAVVTHNVVVNALVESGLFAAIALTHVITRAVRYGCRCFASDAGPLIFGVAVAVMAMSLNWADRRCFWVGLALALTRPRKERHEIQRA